MTRTELSRFEYKYLVRREDFEPVRQYLLRYCAMDANAQGMQWYGIRSLYLDRDDYKLYRISANKEYERLKLRVRGYATATGPVKMEVKRRSGDVVTKSSLVVPNDMWQTIGERGMEGFYEKMQGNPEFRLMVEQLGARPKVLVQYERHALFSRLDDYVRVTFDRNIVCQRMRDWRLEPNPRAWRAVDDPATVSEEESTYVLELKFQVQPPLWLRDVVLRFGLTRRGFSKYVRAVERLESHRAGEWDLRTRAVLPQSAWRIA